MGPQGSQPRHADASGDSPFNLIRQHVAGIEYVKVHTGPLNEN